MNNLLGFTHIFETSLGKYLYDVNTHSILEISNKFYNYSKSNKEYTQDTEILSTISSLRQFGFLKNKHVENSRHPETPFIKYYLRNHMDTLSLQVTQNCNLRCDYCVYSGKYTTRTHNIIKMDEKTAKKGIDLLIKNSKDCGTLFLGFYGGEPLLEYSLIKDCMDYIIKNSNGKEIYFSLTTNGTLLTAKIVDELVKYNIHIMVSLDGPKEVHDESRRFAFSNEGTFDTIIKNLEYVKNKYPSFYKQHISYNIVLHNSGFNDVDNFTRTAPLLSSSIFLVNFITESYSKKENTKIKYCEETKIQYEYERFLLYAHKIGFLRNYTPSRLVLSEFYKLVETIRNLGNRRELPSTSHRNGACIPGVQKLFLTAKGEFFPCERVNECSKVTKIGDVDSGLDLNKIIELTNLERYTSEKCRNCWAYSFCGICLSGIEDEVDINLLKLERRCISTLMQTESILKDYCVLKKLGCDFDSIINANEYDTDVMIDSSSKTQTSDRSIYNIKIPVVFITEFYSKLIKEDTLLNIKIALEKQGVRTLLISEQIIKNKNEDTLAESYMPFHDIWGSNDITAEDKICFLNHYIKDIERKNITDLVIVSIPGGVGRFSNKFTDGFGLNLHIANEALAPDCTIMFLPYDEYSMNELKKINDILKSKLIYVDYFNIVPLRICIDESERNQTMHYLTLDNDIVDNMLSTINNKNFFNLNHTVQIQRLSESIINQLSGYACKLFEEV